MSQARADYGDSSPYGLFSYEEPIYRRLCEEYGAGQLWHDNRKCVQTAYLTNKTGDSRLDCLRYKVDGSSPVASSAYASGELSVVMRIMILTIFMTTVPISALFFPLVFRRRGRRQISCLRLLTAMSMTPAIAVWSSNFPDAFPSVTCTMLPTVSSSCRTAT